MNLQRKLSAIFALIAWFAVIAQLAIMIENSTIPLAETLIRFFSYFTILANILVAVYFTRIALDKNSSSSFFAMPGTLTAITCYIFIVGLVYQVALRHIWQPKGLQLIVDELLHSAIPLITIIYWRAYERARDIKYYQIIPWTIFPIGYLLFILARGDVSGFYPYPFIDVSDIGMTKALTNAGVLLILFLIVAALFILIGKTFIKR